ncbi:MAG: Gfo/Idh/MocA family protein [Isosphaeraceae bacterium]
MSQPGDDWRFLLVGAGYLGARRAAALGVARGAVLAGVYDTREEAARSVARRHDVECFDDLDDALRRPDFDAVIVATPHADHFEQVSAALDAGKHVLCEKPLTIRPEDARALATRADELRLRLATGFNHRFYPPVRDALSLVAAWRIGRVEGVRAEIGHQATPEFLTTWHTDVARSGGGTLMDNGPHACDLIRQFLGEVVAVTGYRRESHQLPRGCEIEACGLFRDFDQNLAELRSSWNQIRGYLTMEVRGSDGCLRIETAPWRLTGVLSNGREVARGYVRERLAERVFRARFGCERTHVQEIESFVSSANVTERPSASGWDGCRATEMVDAIYRSSESGREVRLKPLLVQLPSAAHRRALGPAGRTK